MIKSKVAIPAILIALALFCSESAPGNTTVEKYAVFETGLVVDEEVTNPFTDVDLEAVFREPGGNSTTVAGFYYKDNRWQVRFVPRKLGTWHYTISTSGTEKTYKQQGSFECVESAHSGFLRVSKRNPYRMEYDNGKPFYPLGLQTTGNVKAVGFDGPQSDGDWRSVSPAEWCDAFRGVANLIRLQLGGGIGRTGSTNLIDDSDHPDRYNLDNAAAMDRMYQLHREAGFSQIAILFEDMSLHGKFAGVFGMGRDIVDYKSLKASSLPLQEQYLRYVVARYGCYVDIWELFNEDSYAPDDYLAHLYKVIREADPYDHIITSNYCRPEKPFCEIVTCHEYVAIGAETIDALLSKQLAAMKSYGKPVQYTEFGNTRAISNVDPVKWRVAAWTCLINESGMLYWDMSGMKTIPGVGNGNANAYIGPETRRAFRVIGDFWKDLPIDMRPRYSKDTTQHQFHSYALSNGEVSALYLHRQGGYEGMTQPQVMHLRTGHGFYKGRWIDPATGKLLSEQEATYTSHQYLTVAVPAFSVDAACRIDRVAPPAPGAPPAPAIAAPAKTETATSEWKMIYEADFSQPGAAQEWLIGDGHLSVNGGILSLSTAPDSEGEITLRNVACPASVRVEYVGWLEGQAPCDLSALLNANARGLKSANTFQFGGYGNTRSRIVRSSTPISEENFTALLEIGRAYRVVVENDQGKLRLLVDGTEIANAVDSDPLSGRDHDAIGFYTFNGTMHISELRVFVLK